MPRIDYDKIAEDYARHRLVHPRVLDELAASCRADPRVKVLEAGCGTGNYILTLREAMGAECTGLDPSRKMLAVGRRRGRDQVAFVLGRAEALPFAGGSFDLIFSVDVIHHLRGALDYFIGAFRALKPGGRLVTVTDSEAIIRRRTLTHYFPETATADLARYPAVATLRVNLKAAGFTRVKEKTVSFDYRITDLAPFRDKAYSVLRLIPDHAFRRGLAQMEADLKQGPIQAASRYLLIWADK